MSNTTGDGVTPRTRAQRRVWSYAVTVYVILGIGGLAFYLMTLRLIGLNELAAMAIGGLVGAVEILGRYRHAPFRAVLTLSGLFYVLINIGAAWAAYYMLGAFHVFATTTVAKDLTQVLTAGFGSLVFMRSSIFNVRVGDSDIGIGPAAILDALLLVADRGVDRLEAVARAQDVTELVSHVRDPRVVAKMLTKYSLALMQNVDAATSQQLSDSINKIMDDPDVPDQIKMDIVALQLGVVVGPEVLEAAVAALGDRLYTPTAETSRSVVGVLSRWVPGATARSRPTAGELKAEIDRARAPAAVTP
ncbi:MAG: hypothetical protein P8Y71_22055 [Pseudolabrys sp.]